MRVLLLLLLSFFSAGSLHAQALSKVISEHAGARSLPPSDLDKRLESVNDTDQLLRLARALSARGDHLDSARVWGRLAELRPHVGAYRLELAAELATHDYKTLSYDALLQLQAQGYAFDPKDDKRFVMVSDTEVWTHILKGFQANSEPFGEGELKHTLPHEDLLIESLAWDGSRKALLVGSARTGSVYQVSGDGALKPLIEADEENGMWGVFDLVVDAKRGVLWVASTAVPHFSGYSAETDLGAAGIFKFDLKTGRFIKSFLSPQVSGQQFFMSSVALAPDGTLYAADGVNNAIYMVREDKLTRLAHNPVLSSIRGLSVSGDGRILYFSDYERGIFGMFTDGWQPFEVAVPKSLALGGVDDIVAHDGGLLLVQSGMLPKRIMKLRLDPTGRVVEAVQPLEANKDVLSLPTAATLVDDKLLIIANSQRANYDRFGLLRDKNKLEPTRIYQVDINFGAESAPASAAQ